MSENNPSITTPTVDTSSWNIPSMAPSHVSVEQPKSMFTADPKIPAVTNRSGEIESFIGSMRYDAQSRMNTNPSNNWLKIMDPNQGKKSMTTTVPLQMTHELMNDGKTWAPKYESYLIGVDNDTRLSAQQTSFEKITNPLKRFASNTSKGALDIGAFVYGVGAMAMTGRFDALYDNSMSKYVDDLTNRTNFEYKNYYDAETKKKGLGLDVQTFDKVLGGAEFTARMLASEAIIAAATGGTSLPGAMARTALKGINTGSKIAKVARIGEVGRDISKMMSIATAPERTAAGLGNVARMSDRVTDAMKVAAKRGNMGELMVQGRFALTSPMYEAGFEAMHFRKEAEREFFDYYKAKGETPTADQINAFSSKMAGASNAVFATNMAILSISNLTLFGDMMGVKNPLNKAVFSPSKLMKEKLFRIGTEKNVKTGLNQAIKASAWNKAAAYLSPVLKGAVVEGLYEEGSQGIASGTLKNYVASAYDEELMTNTANYIDAFGKSFEDQFGTKEGQEEIIIGALIGGLFGGAGGIKQARNEYKQQERVADVQNIGEEFIANYSSNAYTNEQILTLFSGQNRFQNLRAMADEAEVRGDHLGEASAKAQSFIALLDSYHTVGKETEFTEMFGSMLKGMDNQTIADSTGLDLSEIDAFKQEQVDGMNRVSENYSTARKVGEYMFKPNMGGFVQQEVDGKKVKINSQNLVSSFAFATTMGEFNSRFAGETFDALQQKLGEVNTSPEIVDKLTALGALQSAHALERDAYSQLAETEVNLKSQMDAVADQINTLSADSENTGRRVELSKKLGDIQEQLRTVGSKKDSLWKTLVDNFYTKMDKTGYANQLDFQDFTKQVNDIQGSLDGMRLSQSDKIAVEKLLTQFKSSNDAYLDFTDLAQKLADPKFTYNTYKGLLAGTRAKMDKSMNEHTQETLMKIYGYTSNMEKVLGETRRDNTRTAITDDKLVEGYAVTPEDLDVIKRRIDSKSKLSPNEQKFYDNNKQAVDEYQTKDTLEPADAESVLTKIDEISVQKQAVENELTELESGIFSDDVQKKMDKLNDEIDTLKQEIEDLVNNTSSTTQQKVDNDSINGHPKVEFKNPNFEQEPMIIDGDTYNIVTTLQRTKTIININGVKIPFYLTSGIAGKNLVEGWYPYFGVGKDGWMNKTDKSDMETYYERYWGVETAKIIREVAEELNNAYGVTPNYRPDGDPNATGIYKNKPLTSMEEKVEEYINSQLSIAPSSNDSGARKNIRANVEQLGREILAKYDSSKNKSPQNESPKVEKLNQEIQALEQEIASMENSTKVDEDRKQRMVESQKTSYQQYEYVKANGDTVIGYLEVNKGILQLVNESEIIDIQETNVPLRNLKTTGIKGLTKIEDDVIVGTNEKGEVEIYANDKLYRLPRKVENLDDVISQDKNGNYEVELRARNGRVIKLKGNVADAIVYQNLLNKIEQNENAEQIERRAKQAEADAELEGKYETLVSKTEDRDSEIQSVNDKAQKESERAESERQTKLVSKQRDRDIKMTEKSKLTESERKRLMEELEVLKGNLDAEVQKEIIQNKVNDLREQLLLEYSDEQGLTDAVKDEEIGYYQSLTDEEFEQERKDDLTSIKKMTRLEKVLHVFPAQYKYNLGGLSYYGDSVSEITDLINNYYDQINREAETTVPVTEISDDRKIKIKNLLYWESELRKLNDVKTDFNPDGTPIEQLDWIISNIPDLKFENSEELASTQKPEVADVNEYIDLLNTTERTQGEKERLVELREKLLPYNLMEGLDLDGVNILDIIDLYNQAKNIQDIQDTQNDTLVEEDFQKANKSVKDQSESKNEYRSPKVGLVYDGAYIEFQNKIQKVFHIKLLSYLTKSLEKGHKPLIAIYTDGEKGNQDIEREIEVTPENVANLAEYFDGMDNIKIDLGDDLYIKKPKGEKSFHVYGGDILFLLDSVGYEITGQGTNYVLMYEPKVDGTFGPKDSEFKVTRDGITIPFDKKVLNSIKPGEKLTLDFDPRDDYNQTLDPSEYPTKGNIYVRKNGKLVQILKSTDFQGKVKGEGWEQLAAIRKKVIGSKTPITIQVDKSYLGLPIVSLTQDGALSEIRIDEAKVLAYGYMDAKGEYQGDIANLSEIDNDQYVTALKGTNKIIPVVAFNAYGQTILFPMNVKAKGVDLTGELDNILTDQSKSREQKMFEINAMLEQNNLFNQDLALNSSNMNIEAVREALTSVQSKLDITDAEQFKNADKYSYIDMNDPFMSSKLVFKLDNNEQELLDVGKSIKVTFVSNVGSRNSEGIQKADSEIC